MVENWYVQACIPLVLMRTWLEKSMMHVAHTKTKPLHIPSLHSYGGSKYVQGVAAQFLIFLINFILL